MPHYAPKRNRGLHGESRTTATVRFFGPPNKTPPGMDRFTSEDGRITAIVGNREARIFFPRGKPSRLYRLGEATDALPNPHYSDGFVTATLRPSGRFGTVLALPGCTLYEVA